jgi:hypothetical protein
MAKPLWVLLVELCIFLLELCVNIETMHFFEWTPYESLYNLLLHAQLKKLVHVYTNLNLMSINGHMMQCCGIPNLYFLCRVGPFGIGIYACSKHQDLTTDLQLDPPIAKSKVQFNPISRDSNRPRNLFALEILLGILSYYVLTENFGLQYCRNCPQICPSNWPPRQY